ncbi:hypothetical protein [Chloroflexus sp.]
MNPAYQSYQPTPHYVRGPLLWLSVQGIRIGVIIAEAVIAVLGRQR